MTPVERAAALARRDRFRSIPTAWLVRGDYYCEVVIPELIDQADALEADLAVADTNLTRVEAERDRLRTVARHAADVMRHLEQYGSGIVGHLLDTDDNSGEFLRRALVAVETDDDDEPATPTTQEWESGVGGQQCSECGRTTIVHYESDPNDPMDLPVAAICRPCWLGLGDQ